MAKMVRPALMVSAAAFCIVLAAPPTYKSTPKPTSRAGKATTYAGNIAAILNKHCVECHRPGEVAPFSLIGYENAKKWSPNIATVTHSKRMPPWKAVEGFGEFRDENRLSATEMEAIAAWVKSGAPRGDSAAEPVPPKFTSEWRLGHPDLILQPGKQFKIGPEGADVYRNFVIPTSYKETRWVTAMDVKPGNPKIVHHVIAFLDEHGRATEIAGKTSDGQEGYSSWGGGVGFMPDGSFGGWAPGVRAKRTAGDVAFELKPGATIVMQVHYHKDGKPEEDLTKLGLYFSPKPPQRILRLAWLANPLFRLEPGKKDQKVELRLPIPVDVTLYGAMPHMHMLGRSMKASLELPDGSIKPLIYIDDWDFNWQLTYAYKEPIRIPKGSKIRIEAIYDNSAANPRNPNSPPKPVTWGEQTTDEMMLFVAAYTTDDNVAFNERAALIKELLRQRGGR